MGENLRPWMSSAPPDLGCINELTRSNSDSFSLTHENLKDICNQNAYGRPGHCTAWTDGKHSLYLDSLEASFVHQLHQSKGLLAWCSAQNTCDPNLSCQLPSNTCNSSDQFMVRQGGCYRKIKFERNQPALDSHVNLNGSQMHNFGCTGKSHTIAPANLQKRRRLCGEETSLRGKGTFSDRLVASLEQLPICHQYHLDSVGSITEVSDQNFVDEDREEKSSSLSMAKRLKTAAADTSSKDQIVPQSRFI
ncbi:cold-regulated protein 28 [Cornus florida]|uniref:cold-regulated protein 28 n=1 Tax=Cornus florida TaxID=4283 RepID=UPI0028A24469|nr:cold-regulated protein 28 [Cornus florida]